MAFWGMDLTQSDEFCKVYDEFIDLYEIRHSPAEITASLLQKYQAERGGFASHAVYFAIAQAQWKLGTLSQEILSKVDQLIESGENIAYYRSLGFSQEELDLRQAALTKFQASLQLPPKSPAKRKVSPHNQFKRLPKGTVSWYGAEDGYYGFAVLDAVYDGRLLAITEKMATPPQTVDEVLSAPTLTAIWLYLRTVPKGNHDLGMVEIQHNYNGRAGVFLCKPISFGINFSFHLDECHRRVLWEFSRSKISDLLHAENVPVKFFREDTADAETKLVFELMDNPASDFAKEMIRKAINLEGFFH